MNNDTDEYYVDVWFGGCNISIQEVAEDSGCTVDEVDEDSLTTNSGGWYCHRDCFKDTWDK